MINPPLFHLQLGQVKEDAAKSLVPYTLRCSYGSKAHGIFINHPGTEPAYPILFIQDQQDAVLGPVMLHGQQAVALPSPAELIAGKIQQIHRVLIRKHLKMESRLIGLFQPLLCPIRQPVAVQVLAHGIAGLTLHITVLFKKCRPCRIIFSIHAREKVTWAVGRQSDVLCPPCLQIRLRPHEELCADSFALVFPCHEHRVNPSALRLRATFQIRKLPFGGQQKSHCLPILLGHITQIRIKVVVQKRLLAEFMYGYGVCKKLLVPKFHHLGFICLVIG